MSRKFPDMTKFNEGKEFKFCTFDEKEEVIDTNWKKYELVKDYRHKPIKAVALAMDGLAVEEQRDIDIEPEDAFGPVAPELIANVRMADLPAGFTPIEGQFVRLYKPIEGGITARITKIDGDIVTIDANHRLAGKKLIVKIERVR